MSLRSEAYLAGIPTKPYDLLREGLVVLAVIAAIVLALAVVFGSPDYPPVTGRDVAQRQPLAFLGTTAGILAGESSIQTYGPPYTADRGAAQRVFGLAPANLMGVTIPLDPAREFVLRPLERLALLSPAVADALRAYEAASGPQRASWLRAYRAALTDAVVAGDTVRLPAGDFGPVPVLMGGMLRLGRAGLLEGALEAGGPVPYTLDFTRALLFFQDDVDHGVARRLDMTGEQWGISHETGPFPGAWWLWPYTFLYQIPPMSESPDGDLQVGVLMSLLFVVLVFLPFIPVLRHVPSWIGVHRIIWRDWYAHHA
jgi:hypothetical protein